MANITLRQGSGNTEPRLASANVKNAPLTNSEVDNNFNNLNNDINNRVNRNGDSRFTGDLSVVGSLSSDVVFANNFTQLGETYSSLHRSPNAITAMFIYDVSKDSDGGAWTEKCSHTSWYNETIYGKWLGAVASEAAARAISGATTNDYFQLTTNGKFYKLNDTSGTTEVFRGNKRSFPKLAAIVSEAASVTIYDLTEVGRPMWRRITASSCAGVAALNGWVVTAQSNTPVIDYGRDRTFNAGGSGTINAVAIASMPDAPACPCTGLKIPTLAMARSTGLSILQNSGSLVNSSSTSAFTQVTLTPQLLSAGRADAAWYYTTNPGSLGASFALSSITDIEGPDFNNGTTATLKSKDRSTYFRNSSNTIQILKNNENSKTKGITSKITETYNTGYLVGDIQRCYIANTVAGNVASSISDVSYKDGTSLVIGSLTANTVSTNTSLVAYSGFKKIPHYLFETSESVWYEPGTTTCFTDTSGITPAVANNSVARINDSSGNGYYAVQATSNNQPMLRLSNNYYLELDSTDTLTVTLPNLSGGNYSNTASVYYSTATGMVSRHNQIIGTTYNLPGANTNIYSWAIFPNRLPSDQESELELYMLRRSGVLYNSLDLTWDSNTDTYYRSDESVITQRTINAHVNMKRCILNDAGEVVYYLNSANSAFQADGTTPSNLSGADGQVMVEIPQVFVRYSSYANKHTWSISDYQLPGYELHPAFVLDGNVVEKRYIGAYNACVANTVSGLYESGLNWDVNVGAGQNWNTSTYKLASVSGVFPACGIYRSDSRTMSANRGTRWRQLDFDLVSLIQLLYLVEYGSFNSQAKIGNGNTRHTTWPESSANQSDSRANISGLSNSIGNATGNYSSGTINTFNNGDFMSYRGIENFFGNIWNWVDGINSNSELVYRINSGIRTNLADNTSTNYTLIGSKIQTDGYPTKILKYKNGFIPTAVGGNQNTYLADYYYQSTGWRVWMVGGAANAGVPAGAFYWYSGAASSNRYRRIGARLVY